MKISGGIKVFSFSIEKVRKMFFENVWEPCYLKKSVYTTVPSSVWWMCLAAFTKLRNIGSLC